MKTISVMIADIEEEPPWLCAECGDEAIVMINGRGTCHKDLERTMAGAFADLYRLLGVLRQPQYQDEPAKPGEYLPPRAHPDTMIGRVCD